MPSKPAAVTMDAVYTAPGYLFRRMQQIAVAIFMEECSRLRSHAGAICERWWPFATPIDGIDATRLSARRSPSTAPRSAM